MTIEDVNPIPRRSSSSSDEIVTPLLPKSQGDEVAYDEFNGASFNGAVFNLATTIIGAGIMALPATMKILGLVLGISMIVVMAFLTDASIEFLLRFSKVGKNRSYGGLMGGSFGNPGRILLQVAVLVNNIGVLIVYMIIIGIVVLAFLDVDISVVCYSVVESFCMF